MLLWCAGLIYGMVNTVKFNVCCIWSFSVVLTLPSE
jgi:hypothetical protein